MHVISKFRCINNSVDNDLYFLTIEKHFEEYVVCIVTDSRSRKVCAHAATVTGNFIDERNALLIWYSWAIYDNFTVRTK